MHKLEAPTSGHVNPDSRLPLGQGNYIYIQDTVCYYFVKVLPILSPFASATFANRE